MSSYLSNSRQEETLRKVAHRQVLREITSRMDTYINVLVQTRSMFYVTREVDRKEFREYVENLEILQKYPGIQGIGFAVRIPNQGLNAHVEKIQADIPEYRVWPPGERNEFYPIIYLEPQDWRNRRAIGYDMFSETVRKEAMSRAGKENRPVMSGPVELVQETELDPQVGFLIYVPVYAVDDSSKVLGLVYSPFRAKDLFQQIMQSLSDLPVDVEVSFQGESLFDREPGRTFDSKGADHKTTTIEIAGKKWKVTTYPLTQLTGPNEHRTPYIILVLGSLITFIVTFFLQKTRAQAGELIRRSETLQQIQDASRILTSKLELREVLQSLTDIGLELSRAEFGAFFYNTVDDRGESYMLYTLSGLDRSKFEKFPMPGKTEVFSPTFEGASVLSGDITQDPRFGKNAPYYGHPSGHPPVRSYLAVAVKSKTGDVIGALFYGHQEKNKFTQAELDLIEGISQNAAIAIDNASLYQKAQKAIASREEFLNIASHELKTPITSMKIQFQSAIRMIQKDITAVYEPEAVKRRVTMAIRQLERMTTLIEEMLDSSRISLGKFEISKKLFDFRKLTEEVLERYEEILKLEKIPLTAHFTGSDDTTILGDEYRLEQVLNNLINNAIKYGDKKPIEVHLFSSPEVLRLSVKDQGRGVTSEDKKRIFVRYERLVSANNVSGLGLGLYISKSIVEAHGGMIWVESEPGQGANFIVEIPKLERSEEG